MQKSQSGEESSVVSDLDDNDDDSEREESFSKAVLKNKGCLQIIIFTFLIALGSGAIVSMVRHIPYCIVPYHTGLCNTAFEIWMFHLCGSIQKRTKTHAHTHTHKYMYTHKQSHFHFAHVVEHTFLYINERSQPLLQIDMHE